LNRNDLKNRGILSPLFDVSYNFLSSNNFIDIQEIIVYYLFKTSLKNIPFYAKSGERKTGGVADGCHTSVFIPFLY